MKWITLFLFYLHSLQCQANGKLPQFIPPKKNLNNKFPKTPKTSPLHRSCHRHNQPQTVLVTGPSRRCHRAANAAQIRLRVPHQNSPRDHPNRLGTPLNPPYRPVPLPGVRGARARRAGKPQIQLPRASRAGKARCATIEPTQAGLQLGGHYREDFADGEYRQSVQQENARVLPLQLRNFGQSG